MKLKTIAIGIGVFLVFLTAISGCNTGMVGNGHVEVRDEPVDPFTRLEISGNFKVILEQGNKTEVRFELDENLYDILRVRQQGQELSIWTEVSIIRARKRAIHITTPDLEKLELSGAVVMDLRDPFEVESLVIIGSGAMELNAELVTDRIKIDLSGASDCNLSGETELLEMTMSGAGDFNSLEMIAEEVRVDIAGAGSARVFAEDDLYVDISGVGSVRYRGDPDIHKNVSGLGSLKRY